MLGTFSCDWKRSPNESGGDRGGDETIDPEFHIRANAFTILAQETAHIKRACEKSVILCFERFHNCARNFGQANRIVGCDSGGFPSLS